MHLDARTHGLGSEPAPGVHLGPEEWNVELGLELQAWRQSG